MTTSELRKEVREALKSVQSLPTDDTLEVETDNLLEVIQKHVEELGGKK